MKKKPTELDANSLARTLRNLMNSAERVWHKYGHWEHENGTLEPYDYNEWASIKYDLDMSEKLLDSVNISPDRLFAFVEEELRVCRANHKHMVDRNALLRDRHDMPVDRIGAHDELIRLQQENRDLEEKLKAYEDLVDKHRIAGQEIENQVQDMESLRTSTLARYMGMYNES